MLNRYYFYVNPDRSPYRTLALEEYMARHVREGEIILHLYTHADTVVIGRNQNAWSECRHEELARDGGTLSRRISGGGAVFHDVHNLNFSFVVRREDYDLYRQLKVILDAVKSFGIHAEFSGRNDILADGRKFSGNAFCFKKDGAFHHGTILIDTDMRKLSKYLAVPKDKIESKGIASVRSRVLNLAELNPGVTSERMADALKVSFEAEYGEARPYPLTEQVREGVEEIARRNRSWEWLFGESPSFDIRTQTRFSWGGVELLFRLKNAIVREARVFSDAMDADFIASVPDCVTGVPFRSADLAAAVRNMPRAPEQNAMADDIAAYLEAQGY